jgi:hypothetical protein
VEWLKGSFFFATFIPSAHGGVLETGDPGPADALVRVVPDEPGPSPDPLVVGLLRLVVGDHDDLVDDPLQDRK